MFMVSLSLQMFPVALVCGNTYVFKPSERVPGATMMLVEMLQEAGCPRGVVNVIHGQHKAVNFICDDPHIKAISFVGSDTAVSLVCLLPSYSMHELQEGLICFTCLLVMLLRYGRKSSVHTIMRTWASYCLTKFKLLRKHGLNDMWGITSHSLPVFHYCC